MPENRIDPVFGDRRNTLLLHKAQQVGAVSLLLFDEQMESAREIRVIDSLGISNPSLQKAPAVGSFTQLELLDGVADGVAFLCGELVGIVPGQMLRCKTVVREVLAPCLRFCDRTLVWFENACSLHCKVLCVNRRKWLIRLTRVVLVRG